MYHIIINPSCGSGKGKQSWYSLKRLLNLAKVTYIAHNTASSADVSKQVRKLTDPALYKNTAQFNHLMVIGGDGTLNHCINGISDLTHTYLTYLPSGTSNDLSRSLELSHDPIHAIYAMGDKGRTTPIDLPSVYFGTKKRRFAVSAGIGYDASVCHEAQHSPMKAMLNRIGLGKLVYAAIALKQFIFLKPCGCKLYLDDQEPITFDSFLLAAFMNVSHEGGGFPFAPDADPSDGLLDICIVGNIPKLMVPVILPSVLTGKHYGKKGVHHYKASKIRIVTQRPLCCHTDGEHLGFHKELSFTCGEDVLNLRRFH